LTGAVAEHDARGTVNAERAVAPLLRVPRRPVGSLVAAAVLVANVVACSAGAGPTQPNPAGPRATWPVSPEPLPNPTTATSEARVTCGGPGFPLAGLNAPTGAESAAGPEYEALRESLAEFGRAFPGSEKWTWRLADRDAKGAVFLARTDEAEPPGWVSIVVTTDGTTWKSGGMGYCDPHVVLSPEFGPASWALDPAFPPPTATSTEIHILVWERACSGGSPTTGRMSAPVVDYGEGTVTVTIGVRPVRVPPGMALGCPGPPGTPASLRLREPLGLRKLLDGGHVPAAVPSPMF
jgi:hypothetical protein